MEPHSSNSNIVIFGGTGGVGSALARQLASAGCRMALVAREEGRLQGMGRELGAALVSTEATDVKAVERCFGEITDKWGRLDGVANCVGSLLLKPAQVTTDDQWAATLSAKLGSSFYILRAAVSRMLRTGGGAIVLMASAVAQHGMIHHEAIAPAKAGVVGLARSAGATYARSDIRLNCVAPKLTRMPLTQPLTKNEASLKASTALHPLGRIGELEEVASDIRWSLSPDQSFVTGPVLTVDGGLSSMQSRQAFTT